MKSSDLMKAEFPTVHDIRSPIDDYQTLLSNVRAKEVLGWQPTQPLARQSSEGNGVEIMRTVSANGLSLPALGQGGWHIGDDPMRAADEMAALRLGLDLGLSIIDTAEMYGSGNSERLIGRALSGIPRESYNLVSKVLPQNAGKERIFSRCEASLRRLNTDYIDLYLLHWRGSVPLTETVECMEALTQQGKIVRWGVSNFDTPDMEDLWSVPGGDRCAVDQVLYHLASRGIEFDLLPWLREHRVATMAYCPLAQAGTLKRVYRDFPLERTLISIAGKARNQRHAASARLRVPAGGRNRDSQSRVTRARTGKPRGGGYRLIRGRSDRNRQRLSATYGEDAP